MKKNRRKVCISGGTFWNSYDQKDINYFITKILPKLDVDGLEFLIGDANKLIEFKLSKKSSDILKRFEHNTVHMPFNDNEESLIFKKNKRSKEIIKKAYEIYDMILAKNINIHPQQIEDYSVFDTDRYDHSIENMEKKHNIKLKDYKKILRENPQFKIVLDTTHAIEAQELEKLYNGLKDSIVYSHISAAYFNHLHIPLHALKEEYLKPLNILKRTKVPLVIESQIGTRDEKEYKKEVDFVRKWSRY